MGFQCGQLTVEMDTEGNVTITGGDGAPGGEINAWANGGSLSGDICYCDVEVPGFAMTEDQIY